MSKKLIPGLYVLPEFVLNPRPNPAEYRKYKLVADAKVFPAGTYRVTTDSSDGLNVYIPGSGSSLSSSREPSQFDALASNLVRKAEAEFTAGDWIAGGHKLRPYADAFKEASQVLIELYRSGVVTGEQLAAAASRIPSQASAEWPERAKDLYPWT